MHRPGRAPSEFLRCPQALPRGASAAKQACLLPSPGRGGGGGLRQTRNPTTHPWGWQPHRPSAGARFCARTSRIGPRAAASQTHRGVRLSRTKVRSVPKQGRAAGSPVLRRGTDRTHTQKRQGARDPRDPRRRAAGRRGSGGFLHSEALTRLLGGSLRPGGPSVWRRGWLGARAPGQACAAARGSGGWGGGGSQEFRGVGRSMTMGGFTGW